MIRKLSRSCQFDLLQFRIENLMQLICNKSARSFDFIEVLNSVEDLLHSEKEIAFAATHLRSACSYALNGNHSAALLHLRQLSVSTQKSTQLKINQS